MHIHIYICIYVYIHLKEIKKTRLYMLCAKEMHCICIVLLVKYIGVFSWSLVDVCIVYALYMHYTCIVLLVWTSDIQHTLVWTSDIQHTYWIWLRCVHCIICIVYALYMHCVTCLNLRHPAHTCLNQCIVYALYNAYTMHCVTMHCVTRLNLRLSFNTIHV